MEKFWGDSAKPNIFNSGDNIVVTWVDKYCPEATWAWGTSGESSIQGTVAYPDLATYPEQHVVPYSAVYAAISSDGGTTWVFGGDNPPLQITYGRRDAIGDVSRGAGARWTFAWQEDPEGLQSGEADGPGEGYSGANGSKGTDVWYSWTSDLVLEPLALRLNRTPLTNHSTYDLTGSNGFKMVGKAGTAENHASTRANLALIKDGTTFMALLAYEETKGLSILSGKTVQYHAFPFDAPLSNGTLNATVGDPGTQLSPLLENSRRVRFVAQPPDGVKPAIAIFWKQGLEDQGGPSDIMALVSKSLDAPSLLAVAPLNMSTETPTATAANMTGETFDNPVEDARAHRGVLRGNTIVIGYTYTWNQPLARYTDLANYNFWVRRSEDGGVTWLDPQNVSQIEDTKVNVKEPRLVKTPGLPGFNPDAFLAAWGTETNPWEGLESAHPLDIRCTYTVDKGASFAKVTDTGATQEGEFESQLVPSPEMDAVYAVWMSTNGSRTEALFSDSRLSNTPPSLGTLYCFGDGTGTPCPCGNSSLSDTGEGCINSTGVGGLLIASGSTSVTADDLVLTASQLPPGKLAVAFSGAYKMGGAFGMPFYDGLRCLGSPVKRYGVLQADPLTGTVSWAPGFSLQHGWSAGDLGLFQVWFRDFNGPCSSGSNFTNALELSFLP